MQTIAVPESITREAYIALVRSLGLDPEEIRSLSFGVDAIDAVVYVRDPDTGERILNERTHEMVVQPVRIPVED